MRTRYVIDGMPVSDQLTGSFANAVDPSIVQNIELYTGNVPAEFGSKVSGVAVITTRSGAGTPRKFPAPRRFPRLVSIPSTSSRRRRARLVSWATSLPPTPSRAIAFSIRFLSITSTTGATPNASSRASIINLVRETNCAPICSRAVRHSNLPTCSRSGCIGHGGMPEYVERARHL